MRAVAVHKNSGMSLIELMVACGVFSFVVLGYFANISQTQRFVLEADADNEALMMIKRIESQLDQVVDLSYFNDLAMLPAVFQANYPRAMRGFYFDGSDWDSCVPNTGVDCLSRHNAHFITRSKNGPAGSAVLRGIGTTCVNNSYNKFSLSQSQIKLYGSNCNSACPAGTHPEIHIRHVADFDGVTIGSWTTTASFPGAETINTASQTMQIHKGGHSMPIAAGICFDIHASQQMTVRIQVETYAGGNSKGEGVRSRVTAKTKTYVLDRFNSGDVSLIK